MFLCVVFVLTFAAIGPTSSTISSKTCTVDVKFQLYSEYTGIEDPEDLQTGSTDDVPIDGSLPFKFLIHGWGNTTFWYDEAVAAYLNTQNVNVIPVYWTATNCTAYDVAKVVPQKLGDEVASLIGELYERLQIVLGSVHLVGFSLGAHVAGRIGRSINSTYGAPIGRISGLDPTGPTFYLRKDKLSRTDAAFVDVIHTDAGGLGFLWPIGHVEFYPNGGQTLQKGCSIFSLECSHNRAAIYFVESISSSGFVGQECETYVFFVLGWCRRDPVAVMGENTPRNTTGQYFLRTNKKYPYAIGTSGLVGAELTVLPQYVDY